MLKTRENTEQAYLAQWGQKVILVHCDLADFNPLCWFLYFHSRPVFAGIMINGSKVRKLLVGVEVQSPYVIGRCCKRVGSTGERKTGQTMMTLTKTELKNYICAF